MPKAILEFRIPEEQREFDMALKGDSAHFCIEDIGQKIFRPARKHGYDPETGEMLSTLIQRIDDLIEKQDDDSWPVNEYGNRYNATALIGLLEERCWNIIRGYELSI